MVYCLFCIDVAQEVGIVQEAGRDIHHGGDHVAGPDLVIGGCGSRYNNFITQYVTY